MTTSLEAVVVRSARARGNDFGVTARSSVANPLGPGGFVSVGGALTVNREYDPDPLAAFSDLTAPHAATMAVRLGIIGGDDLDRVPVPVLTPEVPPAPPTWLTSRGHESRAYDLWTGREVVGRRHFVRPSDIVITNGLVRLRAGAWGGPAHVHAQALAGGAWRPVGGLAFSGPVGGLVRWARLAAVTPEAVTLEFGLDSRGTVRATLRHGERQVRVSAGNGLDGTLRQVAWVGYPPTIDESGLAAGAGKFGAGLAFGRDSYARWAWPSRRDAWAVSTFWIPPADDGTQTSSGILGVTDSASLCSFLEYDAATKVLRWTQGGDVLESAPLAFAAGTPVFFALRHDSARGRTLTVKVGAGDVAHVTNPAFTNPGTAETNYRRFFLAPASGPVFGYTDIYSDIYADGTLGTWSVDELLVFYDALTDAEAAALAASASSLGSLPPREGRLVWSASFDTPLNPASSPLVGGRRYEATAPGGPTRSPLVAGLTRGVGILSNRLVASARGIGVVGTGPTFEASAILATTAANDDLADHHAEFAAANANALTVRAA